MTRYAVFTVLDDIEAETPLSAAELALLEATSDLGDAEPGWHIYVVPVSALKAFRLDLRPVGPVPVLEEIEKTTP
jgi:hypothetical protein